MAVVCPPLSNSNLELFNGQLMRREQGDAAERCGLVSTDVVGPVRGVGSQHVLDQFPSVMPALTRGTEVCLEDEAYWRRNKRNMSQDAVMSSDLDGLKKPDQPMEDRSVAGLLSWWLCETPCSGALHLCISIAGWGDGVANDRNMAVPITLEDF